MTGYVIIEGRSWGEITATAQDTWTEEVRGRFQRLNRPEFVRRLSNHVEMKVAMMMLTTGARTAEVVINHAPCGFGVERWQGCHDVLPRFLPRGYSLTVLGTDAHGRPFQHTYEGSADQ